MDLQDLLFNNDTDLFRSLFFSFCYYNINSTLVSYVCPGRIRRRVVRMRRVLSSKILGYCNTTSNRRAKRCSEGDHAANDQVQFLLKHISACQQFCAPFCWSFRSDSPADLLCRLFRLYWTYAGVRGALDLKSWRSEWYALRGYNGLIFKYLISLIRRSWRFI